LLGYRCEGLGLQRGSLFLVVLDLADCQLPLRHYGMRSAIERRFDKNAKESVSSAELASLTPDVVVVGVERFENCEEESSCPPLVASSSSLHSPIWRQFQKTPPSLQNSNDFWRLCTRSSPFSHAASRSRCCMSSLAHMPTKSKNIFPIKCHQATLWVGHNIQDYLG
jgi:hypothetical protein